MNYRKKEFKVQYEGIILIHDGVRALIYEFRVI